MNKNTYTIVGKNFVKVTSQDQSINFKTQHIRLEIFVGDCEVPKCNLLCSLLIDRNQVDPTIVEFPTLGENIFIIANSDDPTVDLKKLLITGF